MPEDMEYAPTSQRNLSDDELSDKKLTNEEKLEMLDKIFDIRLDSKVRNRHLEDGIVEMVGIDYRGVQYLVRYKGHKLVWENDQTIKKTKFEDEKEKPKLNLKTGIKTDFEVS